MNHSVKVNECSCRLLFTVLLLLSQLVHNRQSLSHAATATKDVIGHRSPSSSNHVTSGVSCPEPPSDVMWRRLQNAGTFGQTESQNPTAPSPFPEDDIDDVIIVDEDMSLVTPHPVRHERKHSRTLPVVNGSNRTGRARKVGTTPKPANSYNYETGSRALNDLLHSLNVTARPRGRQSNRTGDDVIVRRRARHVTDNGAADAGTTVPERLPGRTSWHCSVEKYWRRMSRDVYPQYVQTGRCLSSTCMLGLYECRPVKYAVNVLRRHTSVGNRQRCVPVPSTGSADTAYEQAWVMSHVQVTVACQCSRKRAPT